jgi:transposase InsO family protein
MSTRNYTQHHDLQLLKNIYYDPKNPLAFSTPDKLYKAVNRKIPKKKIIDWLQQQRAYTLHKPKRIHFLRNFYDVDNIDDLWETDLMEFQTLADYNDGYKYVLVVIDVFSKYAWTVCLKNKKAAEIVSAFKVIFDSTTRRPFRIQSDKGGEYNNKRFINFLKKINVNYNTTRNEDTKAAVAERFIRTLKSCLYKYLTANNTLRFVDVLQDLNDAYNKRIHRSIGMAPCCVNENNILEVYYNLVKSRGARPLIKKPLCKKNDCVRISLSKYIFSKGYEPNYSEEIFKINKVILRDPVVYQLKDLKDEIIDGVFYEKEIQKIIVNEKTEYLIDKIIKTRDRQGIRESYVKWRGYPDKFNSWVKDIRKNG